MNGICVRNYIVEGVTEDEGPVNEGGQEVEYNYEEDKGQGTSWDSHAEQGDEGREYGRQDRRW